MKKIIATILILVLTMALALPTLADGSTIYDLCVAEYNAHLTADHYSGIRLDKVVTVNPVTHKTSTLIKYTTISADAGFVSSVLKNAGMITTVKTRSELKAMATVTPALSDGAVLFKTSSTGAVSLVGIYSGGYQFYIKGGYIVMEQYAAANWSSIGSISCASPPMVTPYRLKIAPSR